MAGSRLEKLGTIFSRVTSLLKCGAIKPEDKPIWYDVYQVFPPIYEPSYARKVAQKEIKDILYPEDTIRAKFHDTFYKKARTLESLDKETAGITKKVISKTYELIEEEKLTEDEALSKAVEQLLKEDRFRLRKQASRHIDSQAESSNVVENEEEVEESTNIKDVVGKDIDVNSNLAKQTAEASQQIDQKKSDTLVQKYQDALQKILDKKKKKDD